MIARHSAYERIAIGNRPSGEMFAIQGQESLGDDPRKPFVSVRQRVFAVDCDDERCSFAVEALVDLFAEDR